MKLLFAVMLFVFFYACTPKQENAGTSTIADNTTERNKELVRRVYNDMAVKKNYALLDSFCAPNIFDHGAA